MESGSTSCMKTCKVNNCQKKHYAKGYCANHYSIFLRTGKEIKELKIYTEFCTVDGCMDKTRTMNYCNKHYYYYRKYGDPLKRKYFDNNITIMEENENYIKFILKTHKYGNFECFISAKDKYIFDEYRLAINKVYNTVGRFYIRLDKHNKKYLIHRIIMNAPKGMDVDHVNHNTLDNRRDNLRICSRQQNLWNAVNKKKYGFKGIKERKNKKDTKYEVGFRINGKFTRLGSFDTEEAAIKIYNDAIKKYRGKFAYINNI